MHLKDFMQFKNWVVVGDVTNETKYAHKILWKLRDKGYHTEGVHPKGGDGVFKTLKEVEAEVEVLDLCINPKLGLDYMKEAASLGIKYVLIQPGAESEDILTYCRENGIIALEGCALVGISLYTSENI